MLNCVVIEDEPLAAEILQDYIAKVPFLKLIGTFTNALEAMEFIQQNTVHLLFLDIHLPGLKGLDLLKTLEDPPATILTTAYHEYALQSYELGVVDYLLKPIEFNRFLAAVNKLSKRKDGNEDKFNLVVYRDKRTIIIPNKQILYLESQKEYVKIQCVDVSHVIKNSLTSVEYSLSPSQFLRVHRSFIVAMDKVNAYSLTHVEVNGISIPIGGLYRETVIRTLKKELG